jgi:3-methyladenine DNA glycosylase/8-oxoguanine DNA glycosylase
VYLPGIEPAALSTIYSVPGPLDLRRTLGALRHGASDPTLRFVPDGAWRATRTDAGPATVHLSVVDSGGGPLASAPTATMTAVLARAWGPGAELAVEGAPSLTGACDDPAAFEPRHPLVADLHRRAWGFRIPRSNAVFEALLPTILEQKVTGLEAKRAYRGLLARWGSPAPGPGGLAGMMVPPAAETLARLGYAAFHPLGVERKRAETIRAAAAAAPRLAACVRLPVAQARQVVRSVRGVGPWSEAEVALVALGDPDAVSVGDYHLPHLVAWALAGERRGDDARMLELLEPWRGQRGRVLRLLESAHQGPPRRGPRLAPRRIERY